FGDHNQTSWNPLEAKTFADDSKQALQRAAGHNQDGTAALLHSAPAPTESAVCGLELVGRGEQGQAIRDRLVREGTVDDRSLDKSQRSHVPLNFGGQLIDRRVDKRRRTGQVRVGLLESVAAIADRQRLYRGQFVG